MSPSSEVTKFDLRADTYDSGRLGIWHQRIVSRCADVIVYYAPVPLRVIDVGCGTGALLAEFAERIPTAIDVVGVDPAPRMAVIAAQRAFGRAQIVQAGAEDLPFGDSTFDLAVSTLSFDHWADQERGMAEVARVMAEGGTFVLADLCGWWLPSIGKARHRRRIVKLARHHGFRLRSRETIYRVAGLPLVQAFVFRR